MVTHERIEHAIATHPDPVVNVGDVLAALDDDPSDTHVRQKMQILEAAGTLGKKKVGARAVAWWHTERVTPPRDNPAEHPDQSDLSEAAGSHGDESAHESDVSLVAALDLPGQGQKAIDRQQAMLAVLEALDEAGELRAGEIRERVFPEHPAGYEGERSWWKNFVSPALSGLEERGRVELRDRSRGLWASRS